MPLGKKIKSYFETPKVMTETYDKYINQANTANSTLGVKTNNLLNGVSSTAKLNKTLDNIMSQLDYRMNKQTNNVSKEENNINSLNAKMFNLTNEFNSSEAEKARDFTAYMSNTAHQREVNDLKAAGLNPVLSAGGQGATTPSASNASAGSWNGATESALNAMTTMAKAEMDNKTALTSAKINAQSNKEIAAAQISSGLMQSYNNMIASLVSSKGSYKASRYATQKGYSASRYASKLGLSGSLASAGATEAAAAMAAGASYNMAASQLAGAMYSADASKYVANKNFESNKYSVDRSKYGYITNQVNKGANAIKNSSPSIKSWLKDKTTKKVKPSSW